MIWVRKPLWAEKSPEKATEKFCERKRTIWTFVMGSEMEMRSKAARL